MIFVLYSAKCTGLGISQTWVQVSVLPLSNDLTLGQLGFGSAGWGQNAHLEGLPCRVVTRIE